jgi:hypothetical protein
VTAGRCCLWWARHCLELVQAGCDWRCCRLVGRGLALLLCRRAVQTCWRECRGSWACAGVVEARVGVCVQVEPASRCVALGRPSRWLRSTAAALCECNKAGQRVVADKSCSSLGLTRHH